VGGVWVKITGGYEKEVGVRVENENDVGVTETVRSEWNGSWEKLQTISFAQSGASQIRLRIRVEHTQGTPTYIYLTGLFIHQIRWSVPAGIELDVQFRDLVFYQGNEGDVVRYTTSGVLGVEQKGSLLVRFKRWGIGGGVNAFRYIMAWTGGNLQMPIHPGNDSIYWTREGSGLSAETVILPNCYTRDLQSHVLILSWNNGRQRAYWDGIQILETTTNIVRELDIENISLGGMLNGQGSGGLITLQNVGWFDVELEGEEVKLLSRGVGGLGSIMVESGRYQVGFKRIEDVSYVDSHRVDVKLRLEEGEEEI
jgi:hypothetical protein